MLFTEIYCSHLHKEVSNVNGSGLIGVLWFMSYLRHCSCIFADIIYHWPRVSAFRYISTLQWAYCIQSKDWGVVKFSPHFGWKKSKIGILTDFGNKHYITDIYKHYIAPWNFSQTSVIYPYCYQYHALFMIAAKFLTWNSSDHKASTKDSLRQHIAQLNYHVITDYAPISASSRNAAKIYYYKFRVLCSLSLYLLLGVSVNKGKHKVYNLYTFCFPLFTDTPIRELNIPISTYVFFRHVSILLYMLYNASSSLYIYAWDYFLSFSPTVIFILSHFESMGDYNLID